MFIRKEHVVVLRALAQGKSQAEVFESEAVGKDVFSKRLLELRVQGLVDEQGSLTEAGKKLLSAFDGVDLEPLEDPLITSDIIKILELYVLGGELPERWIETLKRRALEGERAKNVLEAYRKAKPAIFITPYIAEFVLSMPPGPGLLSELTNFAKEAGYGLNIIRALEAMRWLKVSPETRGRAYTLTPLGRRMREILGRFAVLGPSIFYDHRIRRLLEEKRNVEEFSVLGLVSGGKLTPFAEELGKAYDLPEVLPRIAPIYVTVEEVRTLSAIARGWGKHKENPALLPTKDWLAEKTGIKNVGEVLHILESKGWVRRKEVKGKDTYEPTKEGEEILNAFGSIIMDVPSDAVKAITFALAGDVPIPEWVAEARKHGLVAGDITKKGWTAYRVSERMVRLPILAGYDAAVLAKVPRGNHIGVDTLVREVSEYVRGERLDIRKPKTPLEKVVRLSISEAEARGYIFVLQDGSVRLTRVGELMKAVLEYGKTREIVHTKFGITPTTYHITRILLDHEEEIRKLWYELDEDVMGEKVKLIYNELKKYTSITVEEVFKNLIIMKRLGLIGDMGVTKAGEYLVKAGELLLAHAERVSP